MGRKNLYMEKVGKRIDEIMKMISDGKTETQVMKALSVSPATWSSYKKDHPELTAAIQYAKENTIHKVENSLIRAAVGYDYDEVEVSEIRGAEGELITRNIKTKTRHIPPSVPAAIFYLSNQAPERYMPPNRVSRVEGEVTVKVKLPERPTDHPTEVLEAEYEKMDEITENQKIEEVRRIAHTKSIVPVNESRIKDNE